MPQLQRPPDMRSPDARALDGMRKPCMRLPQTSRLASLESGSGHARLDRRSMRSSGRRASRAGSSNPRKPRADACTQQQKRQRPCASLHTAVESSGCCGALTHPAELHSINHTTRAHCGTSAATASPRPSRPGANSGLPCAGFARGAASGWWRGRRCWSGR